MKPSLAKKHRHRLNISETLSEVAPFLLIGVDLPFLVVSATSLRTGVALAMEMFIIHTLTLMVVYLFARGLRVWQRALVTATVSTITMVVARQFVLYLFPDLINFVRMHLYLMGVNGITLISGAFMKREAPLAGVAKMGLANIAGFSLLAIATGSLREYLGHGTLWGQPLPHWFKIEAANAPFFGFILLSFLLVLGRWTMRQLSAGLMREQIRKEAMAGQAPHRSSPSKEERKKAEESVQHVTQVLRKNLPSQEKTSDNLTGKE